MDLGDRCSRESVSLKDEINKFEEVQFLKYLSREHAEKKVPTEDLFKRLCLNLMLCGLYRISATLNIP